MKPVYAWALGAYHNGELLGLVKYLYGTTKGEPCIYRSHKSALMESGPIDGNTVRPVKVKIEVCE